MNNPSVRGNLLIGQGVIANGTIAAPGEAIIDGEMSGTIEAGKIIVGKTGKLTADAVANYVDVSGEVTKKTVANISLSIQSGGVVSGEVSYGDLEIMKGGEIMGTITQAKNNMLASIALSGDGNE